MNQQVNDVSFFWKVVSWFSVVPLAIIAQLTYHYSKMKKLPRWKVWSIIGSSLFVASMAGSFAEYWQMHEKLRGIFIGGATIFSEHLVLRIMMHGPDIWEALLKMLSKKP